MATIKEKLKQDAERPAGTILLYREGVFYVAYEHSAWLFHSLVHPFKLKKVFVKCVGTYVVSIGFPMSSLDKLCAGRTVLVQQDGARMELRCDEQLPATDFDSWKNAVTPDEPQNAASLPPVASSTSDNEVLVRLREFPIESKTPLECMIFLSEIKREI